MTSVLPPPHHPGKMTRTEWTLLSLLAIVQFSHIVDFVIMMPLGPSLMRTFGITPEQFGLLVSSYTLSAGISGFLASFFIDRFDRKSCLLFFYVGFTVGTLACAWAPGYEMLLLTRSLTGMFGGVLGSLVLSMAADGVAPQRRGTAMGIVMGSFSLASVFGVPFSLKLAADYGWHSPFLFLGGLSAVVWVVAFVLIPSQRAHLDHGGPRHTPWQSLTHIGKSKNQQLALVFMAFLMLGQFTLIPFLSPVYVANAGMTEAQLPLTYLFGGLCSMIASPLAGRLSDLYGRKILFSFSAILSLFPIFFLTHLAPVPVWVIVAISSLFFIMMSGRMVPAMAMISSTATPEYRGSFMSISSSVQQLAAALASYMAGRIVITGEAGHLLHFDIVGYIAMGFSLLAVATAWKIRPVDQSQSVALR